MADESDTAGDERPAAVHQSENAEADMAQIKRSVDEFLDSSLESLFAQAKDTFFVAARDAASPREENHQVGLMEEVEGLAEPVTGVFREAVLSNLERLGECEALSPVLEDRRPDPAAASHILALVDTLKLDDWVRLRSILGRHEARLHDAELIVEERLSVLAGDTITGDNNPVGLTGMCSLFHDAMQNMGADRTVRHAIFDAFEATVIERLDELMGALGGQAPDPDLHTEEPSQGGPESDSPAAPESGPAAVNSEPQSVQAAPEPVEPVDPARLKGVLDAVVRNSAVREMGTPADAASLQAWLTAVLDVEDAELEDADKEMIGTVSRLVAAVLGDASLSGPVKTRLWQLTTPMLALALQDDAYLAGELEAARHDPVTGLLDRAAFATRLEAAVSRKPDGYGCLLCLIDVDDFSRISATWGRSAGGRLLRLLAALLGKHVGGRGIAARLRGDEFAVLLQGPAVRRGFRFAERFRRAVEQARWIYDGRGIELTVSVGIAAGNVGDTAEHLMYAADTARLAAKSAGGNRVEAMA